MAWIKRYRTWVIILIVALLWVTYVLYRDFAQPRKVLKQEIAKELFDTVTKPIRSYSEDIIEFTLSEKVVKLIELLTPFLIVIFTFRRKDRLDSDIKKAKDIVMRDRLRIKNRRKKDRTKTIKKENK